MPTLLLHTGVSLERLGNKKEAKRFYQSLVALYPKSKAAALAKKNLSKMQ
jgi:TolA-binding protein